MIGRKLLLAVGLLVAVQTLPARANAELENLLTTDAPGSADSPLTGRYDGSSIVGQTVRAFDELHLPSGPAKGETYADDKAFTATVTPQGKVTRTLTSRRKGAHRSKSWRTMRMH